MTKKNKKKKYEWNIQKTVAIIIIVAMVATSVLAIFA